MRWLLVVVLAAGLGTVAAARPYADGSDQVITLNYADKQTPVEQQTEGGATQPDPALWVTNPYNDRAWDADDQLYATGMDPALLAGETLTVRNGVVGDHLPHFFRVDFDAGNPKKAFTWMVTLTPGARETAATVLSGSATGFQRVCVVGPKFQPPPNPLLTLVPDSGAGGYGLASDVTASMSSDRRLKDATVRVYINAFFNAQFTSGCAPGPADGTWTTVGGTFTGGEPRWQYKVVP